MISSSAFASLRSWTQRGLTVLAVTAAVNAYGEKGDQVEQATPAPEQREGTIDRVHRYVNTGVQGTAAWVDGFFDDSNSTAESASTRLRLRQRFDVSRKDSSETRLKISARVQLPRLSKRLSLILEGNDSVDAPDDDLDFEEDDAFEQPSIGMQYLSRSSERFDIRLTAGLRKSPAVYLGPRIRYAHPIGERWLGRYIQNLRWYTDVGWDSDTRADFDFKTTSEGLFRQTIRFRWREEYRRIRGVDTTLATTYTRRLANDAALRYQWSSKHYTKPSSRWIETILSGSYRKRLWRDWFFVEIAPFLAFQEEHDWAANPGGRLTLELIFQRSPTPSKTLSFVDTPASERHFNTRR
jgi:hypothetical protein